MKVLKKDLKKLIEQEINKQLDVEEQKRKVINAFVHFIESKDSHSFQQELSTAGIDSTSAINFLNPEEVDKDFFLNAVEAHNLAVRELGSGEERPVEAFTDFPEFTDKSDLR